MEYSPAADPEHRSPFLNEDVMVEHPSPLIEQSALALAQGGSLQDGPQFDIEAVGPSGAGFKWAQKDGLDEKLLSIAPSSR